MASAERTKNVLPEELKDHKMAAKYEFHDYDEESGLFKPLNRHDFIVTRPHAKFAITTYFNTNHDPFPDLEENTMDEGDILLCSPQKTGTHLAYEMIRMLVTGNTEYKKNPKDETWIEIHPYAEVMKTEKPRILNTHLMLSWLPPNFRRFDTKVIVTMRNPKDAFVSYFHHTMNSERPEADKLQAWPEFFNWLLHCKTVSWASYLPMYADIWDNHRNDPNILIVFFEDLKKDESIKSIAEHIGVTCSPELLDAIKGALNIDKMREVRGKWEGELFYRKGQVGDWKNWFTVAQNEEFHRIYDEWNKGRQIPFRFD